MIEFDCFGSTTKREEETMLEDQPLDLSVKIEPKVESLVLDDDSSSGGEELSHHHLHHHRGHQERIISTSTADDSLGEDSDDSSCGERRPPGTKPYKKNLIRRYRKCPFLVFCFCFFSSSTAVVGGWEGELNFRSALTHILL